MGYDSSGYGKIIDSQNQYIDKLLAQKADLKGECESAETTQENTYQNYKYATGVFNVASSENSQLEQQLKKLQEEMQAELRNAQQKAEAEGKSQEEIDKILSDIRGSYQDKITLVQYNITKSGKNYALENQSRLDAQSAYREARFNNIFASNNYLGNLSSLGNAYHDLGKMQQFQSFLESQSNQYNSRNWTV